MDEIREKIEKRIKAYYGQSVHPKLLDEILSLFAQKIGGEKVEKIEELYEPFLDSQLKVVKEHILISKLNELIKAVNRLSAEKK